MTGHVWRMLVDVRGLGAGSAERLRVLLVADVWRRVREDLHGGQVLAVVLDQGRGTDESWTEEYRLRAPYGRVRAAEEAAAMLAGPPDVAFVGASRAAHLPARDVFRVQPADLPAAAAAAEPLVLRLALLRFPYGRPADPSIARLHRAEETLQRWRTKVAAWADMPSCAPPSPQLDPLRQALADHLDTPAALTGLHRLETDPHLASGAKFEAFVQLDRVLALDLSHLIGKLPR